jgi:hypothetical protein
MAAPCPNSGISGQCKDREFEIYSIYMTFSSTLYAFPGP